MPQVEHTPEKKIDSFSLADRDDSGKQEVVVFKNNFKNQIYVQNILFSNLIRMNKSVIIRKIKNFN